LIEPATTGGKMPMSYEINCADLLNRCLGQG
jgi:hypothetical protein